MSTQVIRISALAIMATVGQTCFADDVAVDRKATMPRKHVAVFKKYCFECHDAETQEGSVNLQDISFEISKDIPTAERWAKVLNAINSGEMPPKGSEAILADDKTSFLGDLSRQMVMARKILSDSGGVITMRRLNRREYANTIEALLGVRPDVSNLPDDQATSGFDTSGASLFFSSDQLEQYLAAAKASLELALRQSDKSKSKTIHIEPEEEYTPHYAAARDEFIDKERRAEAYFAQSEKPPSDFGFLDEYQVKKQRTAEWLPLMKNYLARPETKTGATLIMTIKQGGYTKIKFPTLGPNSDGHYLIRVKAGSYDNASARLHYLEYSTGLGTGRTRLGWRKVTAPLADPEIIEFPYVHRAGEKLGIWVHQRSHQDRGDKNLTTNDMKVNGIGTPPGVWIDWAELVGPISHATPPSAVQELASAIASGIKNKQQAREILHRFTIRAFRGEEPDPDFLDRLVQQYVAGRAKKLNPTRALIGPLSIALASPSFLYMVESTGNENSPQLTNNELAVRLSYLLWSGPPDEQLMNVARAGRLLDSAVLKQQTTRLLADAKADRFVKGFVHQWLQMERLGMFQFDGVKFPTFDNAVRESARDEIFQTVHMMLSNKMPLNTLLNSDFVVINDILADYYGLQLNQDSIPGHQFRKVSVPRDSVRGGLLGTAAVLAMGSDGLRSSPVERGAWVLRHLLNDPPPPAPPNVPQLSRLDGNILSARELQKTHQEEPQCAQCHRTIDPIGFGLENFSADGLWRDQETVTVGRRKAKKEKTFAIDPSGQLPDGKRFSDYFGLRNAVANHEDELARGLAEALIAYGLGRPYGFTDQELADSMIAAAKPTDYELSEFIHALIQSRSFRTK